MILKESRIFSNHKMEYKELNLHEHCLHRPDTYIGSVQKEVREEYIIDDDRIVMKEISIIPAIERLFVEALSNSIDNKWRSDEMGVQCTAIKITIATIIKLNVDNFLSVKIFLKLSGSRIRSASGEVNCLLTIQR